jgi:tetratricopeptide (TPR) repeat protein
VPVYSRIHSLISHCVLGGMALFTLTLLPVGQLHAASCEPVARLVSLEGAIEYKSANTENWNPAVLEQEFCNGDAIRSGQDSRAALRMINETLLRLDHSTAIIFTSVVQKERSLLDLLKGALHFISRVPRSLEVNTPYLNAAIEGTEFVIKVKDESTEVTVYEGKVVASNASGSIDLTANQAGSATSGQAPIRTAVARPRDAVAWTLYYPPLPVQQDQAGMLAQQTIDAIVRNDIDQAVTLAQQAIANNPQSAAAYMAQSYVDQARFDIPRALENSRRAAELAPQDTITQARLAEVLLMTGDTEAARAVAKKAVEIAPLAHSQTVLGFSSLRDVNLDDAESAFNQAIILDSAAPLPHLGLGLVKIRRGDLTAGREEIEIAALLDPNNSLLRSYMGKAYYEEKRDKLASEQFIMARELDPNDPTAWFYDSILLQSENRPVEALLAQQQAIALNDNRGVYRSRQLLDQDEAARNTASARIYSDLGFDKLAILEGTKALAHAPGNFSAHRFMADINATQPQRDIAVESDLLQSKLLQPLTRHSLRPQLSDLDLSDGPARFSYNEFNPLFTKSGPSLLVDGFVAKNNTWGEDVIASYLFDRFSINVGQYHFESSGFREFDTLEKDVLKAFAQYDVSPDTMLQFEYSDDDQENGDLNLHMFQDNNDPGLENIANKESARVGLRHSLSNNSLILSSYTKTEMNSENLTTNEFPGQPKNPATNDETSDNLELQWIQATANNKLLVGAISTDREENFVVTINAPFGQLTSSQDIHSHFNSLYVYNYLQLTPTINLTLGASYTDLNSDKTTATQNPFLPVQQPDDKNNQNVNQFNPKIGVVWDLSDSTTLRATVFRDVPKSAFSATLEPTQISGFNQAYNDFASLVVQDAKRSGIALDHKINTRMFTGFSYLYSDLESFVFAQTSQDNEVLDSTQKLFSAYYYFLFSPKLSFRIEYDFAEFEEPGDSIATNIRKLKTHQLPVGLNYFHSSFLSTSIVATYYRQDGLFAKEGEGEDRFWLVDGSLIYHLPEQKGKLSLGVKNIFNTSFSYEDRENNTLINPDQSNNFFELSPERTIYGKFSINF